MSTCGESEAVRLKAARAVLSDIIAVSKFSDLEERVTEVEESLDKAGAGSSGSKSR